MIIEIAIGAAVIAFGGVALYRALESPEQAAWRKREAWENRRRAQGASQDEIYAEAHIREQLASLREVCTLHVLTVPNGKATWEEVMKREIAGSAHVLAILDPALARQFVRIVSNLRHSDILYPDAHDIVYPMPAIVELSAVDCRRIARIRVAAFTDL